MAARALESDSCVCLGEMIFLLYISVFSSVKEEGG